MSTQPPVVPEQVERETALAFAPLHKRAFGLAVGTAAAFVLFGATAILLLHPPESRPGFLHLLAEYFYGYTVSWPGAFIGAAWGLFVGFIAGWFVAFCRNLVLAASVWYLRTRAELLTVHDLLDHI